jgi:hypothetical protein
MLLAGALLHVRCAHLLQDGTVYDLATGEPHKQQQQHTIDHTLPGM